MGFFDDLLGGFGQLFLGQPAKKKKEEQAKPSPQAAQSFFNAAPLINKATGFNAPAPTVAPPAAQEPAPEPAPAANPKAPSGVTGAVKAGLDLAFDPLGSTQKFLTQTPEGKGIATGLGNTAVGFFTSLLPEQSAGETPEAIADLRAGRQPDEGTVGKAASDFDVAKTAVVDRLLLGAGPVAKTVQGAFLVKTGADQIVNLPGTLEAIQNEKDPQKQIQLATEAVAGIGLTAFGAAHMARGLVETARSPEGKALVKAVKENPVLADERGSVALPGGGAPDPLESLRQEALKYKSADEFVKENANIYHGTTLGGAANIEKSGFVVTRGGRNGGLGVSLTPDENIANDFATNKGSTPGKVIGGYLDPSAKLVDGREFTDLAASIRRPGEDVSAAKIRAMEYFKKQGYDGIDLSKSYDYMAKNEREIRLWNTDQLHTPQQLTDLYNQAHAEAKTSALTPEELAMGKALGMTDEQVVKAKSGELPGPAVAELPAKEVGPMPERPVNTAPEQAPLQRGNVFNEVKRFPEQLKNDFADMVNSRRAAQLEGKVAGEQFRSLDPEGVDALIKAQSGERTGDYGKLREYFDTKFKQLNDAGVRLEYQKDYLPQIWDNPGEEVAKVFANKRLSTTPSFTQSKVIEDYQYGIDHGLTPKFQTVSDLVGWYESTANRAIANQKFINSLIKNGQLLPVDEAPKGWKTIDNELVPTDIRYKADPRLAKVLTNYLEAAQVEGLDAIARFATRSKNIVLGAGVPKTAINSYGLTRLMTSILSAKNPIGAFFKEGAFILRPERAKAFLEINRAEEAKFAKAGFIPQIEDFSPQQIKEGGRIRKAFNWLGTKQQELIEEPTLGKVVPAMKLNYAMEMFDDLKKNGMSEKQARKVASKSANDFFGGTNIEELGRSKDFQNLMRSTILAPDLGTSAVRTGKGIAKGLTVEWNNPEFAPYRRFARNFGLAVIAANVLNKAISGQWMFQNEQGKEFEINTGQKDSAGKDVYIPIFGSSVDFARLPVQAFRAVMSGNADELGQIVRNRLSIPAGVATSLISNTDAFGNPVLGKDKYGNPMDAGKQAANLARVSIQPFLPSQVNAAIGAAEGKTSPEETIARALELPVRFRQSATAGPRRARKSSGRSGRVGGRKGTRKAKKPSVKSSRTRRTSVRGYSRTLKALTRR